MNNRMRNGIIWNACSGGLNAIQSVIWLMLITRILGIYEAGIFTIAYAISNLFLMIGKYGIRNFQVSDVKQTYHWKEYYTSRIVTLISMMFAVLIYCSYMYFFQSYTAYKTIVIFLMTLLKAADAWEDIYYGMYQQKGRLDIAGFSMTIRLALQIVFFSICIFFNLNILFSLVLTNIFSWINLWILLVKFNRLFEFRRDKIRIKELKDIFILCTPLFISSFLSYYTSNLPKYAIDRYMGETEQAYYGFISMPVFVVYLFTNFVYQPMLKDISELWVKNKQKKFRKKIYSALFLIGIISIVVLISGWLFGIWGLNLLYSVNLSQYKLEFFILLLGSVLYAFSSFFGVLLTVIRRQNLSLYINILIFIIAYIITFYMVKSNGILGASLSYMITMGMLCIVFWGVFMISSQKRNM